MFVRCLSLYIQREYPLLPNGFYEKLAGHYHLPTLNSLLAALHNNTSLLDVVARKALTTNPLAYETYFLENIRERGDFNVFMSVENNMIIHLTVQFPTCGDRINSSLMIGYLKSIIRTFNITAEDANIIIEGCIEDNRGTFERVPHLSCFTWNNTLKRYLHISERPIPYLTPLIENQTTWRSMLIAYL